MKGAEEMTCEEPEQIREIFQAATAPRDFPREQAWPFCITGELTPLAELAEKPETLTWLENRRHKAEKK
jgi:hypothetical protein